MGKNLNVFLMVMSIVVLVGCGGGGGGGGNIPGPGSGEITPTNVSILAGSFQDTGSSDGTGSDARFNWPHGVAVDNAGNVYVADTNNKTIRKITSAGVVTTLAGGGSNSNPDGTGSAARFVNPSGVAVDNAGNVYVADAVDFTIRKVTSAGVVTTFAGSHGEESSIDGTGSAARFYSPIDVAVDNAGNVYVTEFNAIRKITPAGVVTTLAGGGLYHPGGIDGTGSSASFASPKGIAVDSTGNVYVADTENFTIRKITSSGVVTTLAGTAGSTGSSDGTGSAARFVNPIDVAVDNAGNVYVSDNLGGSIRKINPEGVVTTPVKRSDGLDVNNPLFFFYPNCLAVDNSNNIYVSTNEETILKITQ